MIPSEIREILVDNIEEVNDHIRDPKEQDLVSADQIINILPGSSTNLVVYYRTKRNDV